MKLLLISIIASLLLLGNVVLADNKHLDITSPGEDSYTGPDVTLTAVSDDDSYCSYRLDNTAGPWTMMQNTGGTTHTQPIAGLAPGEHKAHVHCCEADDINKGCESHGENEHVEWSVNTAIPEYPSAILPALLSIASFGLVSFKLK